MHVRFLGLLILCFALISQTPITAADKNTKTKSTYKGKPKIAFIIDDIGHKKREAEIIARLDAPLTLAVLPFTKHGTKLAELGHREGKEIMLHLPMQPSVDQRLMTEDTLSINMMQDEFVDIVEKSLADVPHIQGVNNHMGSLFTQLPDQMNWLMQTLNADSTDLFFIDSFTSERSIAFEVASQHDIPNAKRDVFLDRELNSAHMQAQIAKLKRVARKNGQAIAIGHPFKETVQLLKQHLPLLEKEGFELMTVSELIQADSQFARTKKRLAEKQKAKKVALNSSSSVKGTVDEQNPALH